MKKQIKAFVFNKAYEKAEQRYIDNTLEALQQAVDGYIEVVPMGENIVAVCDEDGRIKGKPYTVTLNDIDFVGTVLILSVNGDEFDDWDASVNKCRSENNLEDDDSICLNCGDCSFLDEVQE